MEYPTMRMRRLRKNDNIRRMVRESKVSLDDLIMPMIVCPGTAIRQEIDGMPGINLLSPDNAGDDCAELYNLGIKAVILFGTADTRDETGTEASSDEGAVQMSIREIRYKIPEMVIITDACLCAYTSHGHCGILDGFEVDNDRTLDSLASIAISHAEAGADIIAPSAMMDGQVDVIRNALDSEDFHDVLIMPFAAKYASAFYKPYNETVDSELQFGDRKSYQIDPSNRREAVREAKLAEYDSADILMIEPALPCLDIIKHVRDATDLPIAAFSTSGEYAMVMNAIENGLIESEGAVMEICSAIKRAGADLICTWFAKSVAEFLKHGNSDSAR